jgi:hypothetical protein
MRRKVLSMAGLILAVALLSGCTGYTNNASSGPDPTVGSVVAAPLPEGSIGLGTVKKIAGDQAEVLFAKDALVHPVAMWQLKVVVPKRWKVGDKVMAVTNAEVFKPGTIAADLANGKYQIKWENGDPTSPVDNTRIMVSDQ